MRYELFLLMFLKIFYFTYLFFRNLCKKNIYFFEIYVKNLFIYWNAIWNNLKEFFKRILFSYFLYKRQSGQMRFSYRMYFPENFREFLFYYYFVLQYWMRYVNFDIIKNKYKILNIRKHRKKNEKLEKNSRTLINPNS